MSNGYKDNKNNFKAKRKYSNDDKKYRDKHFHNI